LETEGQATSLNYWSLRTLKGKQTSLEKCRMRWQTANGAASWVISNLASNKGSPSYPKNLQSSVLVEHLRENYCLPQSKVNRNNQKHMGKQPVSMTDPWELQRGNRLPQRSVGWDDKQPMGLPLGWSAMLEKMKHFDEWNVLGENAMEKQTHPKRESSWCCWHSNAIKTRLLGSLVMPKQTPNKKKVCVIGMGKKKQGCFFVVVEHANKEKIAVSLLLKKTIMPMKRRLLLHCSKKQACQQKVPVLLLLKENVQTKKKVTVSLLLKKQVHWMMRVVVSLLWKNKHVNKEKVAVSFL